MTTANNLDWKQYEAITKYIYETLGSQSGVTIKGYGSTCKVTGKSGVAHQIDVLHLTPTEFMNTKPLSNVNTGKKK